MKEAQPGTETTIAVRSRPSRFRRTSVDYDSANGWMPSWQDTAARLIRPE
jgi:hypothetical protein